MRQTFFWSVFLIVLLGSCGRQSEFSEREKALFTSDIYAYNIPIDSLNTLEDLIVYLDDIYCEHSRAKKWPLLYYNLENNRLTNPPAKGNTIAFGIEPSPCSNMMFEYDFSRILEIVKDGYNIEVEGERIEPDSLQNYISLQYLNFGKDKKYSSDPVNNGIWLITNKDDKLDKLNKYIGQILRGYVHMANEYSQLKYGKKLNDLTDEQYKELRHSLAFHLSFKYSDKPVEINVDF